MPGGFINVGQNQDTLGRDIAEIILRKQENRQRASETAASQALDTKKLAVEQQNADTARRQADNQAEALDFSKASFAFTNARELLANVREHHPDQYEATWQAVITAPPFQAAANKLGLPPAILNMLPDERDKALWEASRKADMASQQLKTAQTESAGRVLPSQENAAVAGFQAQEAQAGVQKTQAGVAQQYLQQPTNPVDAAFLGGLGTPPSVQGKMTARQSNVEAALRGKEVVTLGETAQGQVPVSRSGVVGPPIGALPPKAPTGKTDEEKRRDMAISMAKAGKTPMEITTAQDTITTQPFLAKARSKGSFESAFVNDIIDGLSSLTTKDFKRGGWAGWEWLKKDRTFKEQWNAEEANPENNIHPAHDKMEAVLASVLQRYTPEQLEQARQEWEQEKNRGK